jgi:hypothetical protein
MKLLDVHYWRRLSQRRPEKMIVEQLRKFAISGSQQKSRALHLVFAMCLVARLQSQPFSRD